MNRYFLAITFALCIHRIWGQQATVVINETKTQYEGQSYLVIESLRLVPDANGSGFSVSASTDGEFYAKAYDKKSNINGSKSHNYVRTETVLKEGIKDEYTLGRANISDKSITFQYFDGLGRSEQELAIGASPSGKDIVQFYVYDDFGRIAKEYLPFTYSTNNGTFLSSPDQKEATFYSNTYAVERDSRPYTEHTFEDSPLNRIQYSYGPGEDWFSNGKTFSNELVINRGSEVRYWQIDGDTPISYSYYPAGALVGTEKTDEDGRVAIEYKNFRNQIILNHVKSGSSSWNDTYYIYDDLGNLRFVLSPEAVDFTPAAVSGDITYVENTLTVTNSNLSSTSIVYGPGAYVKLGADFGFKATTSSTFSVTSGAPPAQSIQDYAYAYEYDYKQRLIKKKVPGSDWEYFVYDQWDRLVLSQDGNLRKKSGGPYWRYTKYDEFNRPVVEGIAALSSITIGQEYSASHHEFTTNSEVGYTLSQSFPSVGMSTVNSVTYYDNYDFLAQTAWNTNGTNFSYVNEPDLNATRFTAVKEQTTGTKIRDLATNGWLATVNYYDNKYRNIQSISENHLGGYDRVSSEYDFTGDVLKTKQVHQSDLGSLTILETFEYDHNGRLLKTYHSVDGASPVLVAENKYNELGQLIEKNHYAPTGGRLQSEDFRYNIRGWLTSINNSQLSSDGGITNDDGDDLFGMNMTYNGAVTVNGTATEPRYNGNISAISWNTNNLNDDPEEQIYGYSYDMLERLKTASYASKAGAAWTGNAGGFDVNITGYDKNGNILGLERYALNSGNRTSIDQLTYRYQGNQLLNVKDNSNNIFGFTDLAGSPTGMTEYGYDKNGNMYYDLNKGIVDIAYNYLNLPTRVELEDNRVIQYAYDAAGNKLSSTATDNGTQISKTDYVGGIHYEDGQLAFATMPEGRILKTPEGWDYEYFLKDHLGNTRLTYGYTSEVKTYLATMETERQAEEDAEFVELDHRSTSFNHTKPTLNLQAPDEVLWLNSGYMGAGKMFDVKNGDHVSMETYVRYLSTSGNANDVVGAVVSTVTSNFGITNSGETAAAYSSFNNYLQGFVDGRPANGAPKAYLIYILFSDDYNGTPQFGWMPMSTNASVGFELLSREINIPYDGHIYIYLANESNYSVYFDDLKIVHEKNNNILQVTQSNDYYPFGLTFNEYQQDVGHKNRYKYNGKELQSNFNLGWIDYLAREYDPSVNRFNHIDPHAETYFNESPYNYVFNNPISHIDPDGRDGMSYSDAVKYTQSQVNEWYRLSAFTIWGLSIKQARYAEKYVLAHGYDRNNLTSNQRWEVKEASYSQLREWRSKSRAQDALIASYSSTDITKNTSIVDYLPVAGATKAAMRAAHDGDTRAFLINSLFAGLEAYGLGSSLIEKSIGLSFEQAGMSNAAEEGVGYSSFRAFKAANGSAGEGMAWHHIVEQTPANVERFGAEAIHNTGNLMRLEHGAGTIHAQVSGYYSSIQPFTNGLRVRQWLAPMSFQEQYQFGIQTLELFGH